MLKVINSSFYALYHILLRLLTLFFVVFGFFSLCFHLARLVLAFSKFELSLFTSKLSWDATYIL